MKKVALLFIIVFGCISIAKSQTYTTELYWYGDACIPFCPGIDDVNNATFNQNDFRRCGPSTTYSMPFYVKSTMSYNYCSIAANPYRFYAYIYRNGVLYTSGYITTSSNYGNLVFNLSESGTYQAKVDFMVKKPSNCFAYQTVHTMWTNSITYSANQNIINNWSLTYGGSSIAASTTPSTPSAVCASQVNNLVMNSTGRSGEITNYFIDVAQVNSARQYVGGQYFSQWYSSLSTTANLASLLPAGFLQPNRYYSIKLALQGPCSNWTEKSVWIYVTSGCRVVMGEDGEEMENIEETKISVYPNPFADNLVIDLDMHRLQDIDVRIFDLSGKEVLSKTIKNPTEQKLMIELNTVNLPSGIYSYQVITDKVYRGKLVK